jgi:hypothetical protein
MDVVNALFYRRPAHMSAPLSPTNSIEQSTKSGATGIAGIPDALSFDRVIAGGTCPVSFPFYMFVRSLSNFQSPASMLVPNSSSNANIYHQ